MRDVMRIFIKNINIRDIKYISKYPIQGLIFSIFQGNAEKVREIIEQAPFYLTYIGEVNHSPKYEIEELIFFCKLKGIIIPEIGNPQNYSCSKITLIDNPYNVLINNKGEIKTKNINLSLIDKCQDIEALVLDIEEFLKLWPWILDIWTKYKVV